MTGEVAVKFFEKTKLSPAVLGEVSAIERQNQTIELVLTLCAGRYGRLPMLKTEGFSLRPALALYFA